MKTAIICTSTKWSEVEITCFMSIKDLSEKGLRPKVVVAKGSFLHLSLKELPEVEIYFARSNFRSFLPGLRFPMIKSFIKEKKIDIVHHFSKSDFHDICRLMRSHPAMAFICTLKEWEEAKVRTRILARRVDCFITESKRAKRSLIRSLGTPPKKLVTSIIGPLNEIRVDLNAHRYVSVLYGPRVDEYMAIYKRALPLLPEGVRWDLVTQIPGLSASLTKKLAEAGVKDKKVLPLGELGVISGYICFESDLFLNRYALGVLSAGGRGIFVRGDFLSTLEEDYHSLKHYAYGNVRELCKAVASQAHESDLEPFQYRELGPSLLEVYRAQQKRRLNYAYRRLR